MNRSFSNFENALSRLEEALLLPNNDSIVIDGTIQRFEFTFEAAWKAARNLLFAQAGIEVNTPRDVLQKAYIAAWFDDEKIWLAMMKHRNETSHIYNETKANEIYDMLPIYAKNLRNLCEFLKNKYPDATKPN